MSANLEPGVKDFRSSYYYKSLQGFKPGERKNGSLERLIKADVFDVNKLKLFCLEHTLPVHCRPLVWKVILGVLPVFPDKETIEFVEQHKLRQYHDLRHALYILGRIDAPANSASRITASTKLEEEVFEEVRTSSPDAPASSMQSQCSSVKSLQQSKASDSQHTRVSHTSVTPSEEFVLLYLLENNRLLSAAKNQLKSESQIRLRAIAEAFLTIFDEEEQVRLYWMYSGFVKMCETQFHQYLPKMVAVSLQRLVEIDLTLYNHLKIMGPPTTVLPLHRWFAECFASDLPESCLESVWDKVMAGAWMVLVFVALAIILSIKRKILGLTSASDLQHVLSSIPRENFTAIIDKGLELWESYGYPLVPCV